MPAIVQQWLAYAVVLVATGWLLRRWTQRRAGGSCDRCSAASPPPPPRRGSRPASLRVLR